MYRIIFSGGVFCEANPWETVCMACCAFMWSDVMPGTGVASVCGEERKNRGTDSGG